MSFASRGLVWIACLLLGTAVPPSPLAARRADGPHAEDARAYLGARVGHITLDEVDDDGSINVGLLGGLFFGHGFSAEVSLDFQESDFTVDLGPLALSTASLERKTIAFQVGLTFTPLPRKTVRPYGLGGVGRYFSEYAFGGSVQDERVSKLGYYAGVGLDFMGERWRETVSVTIDIRWMFTEKEELAGSEVRANGRMFAVGFRHKF